MVRIMRILPLAALLGALLCTTSALNTGLTEAAKEILLNEHNDLRRLQARGEVKGQSAAADMVLLEWSELAAKEAQKEADKCGKTIFSKDKELDMGQNAFKAKGSGTINGALKVFKDQMKKYRNQRGINGYNSADDSAYNQIVTAYTHELGCGKKKCPNHELLICKYLIRGNLKGEPPFTSGEACSKCPKDFSYCKNSLCTSAKVCKNDAGCKCKVDSQKCSVNGHIDSVKCACNCKNGWTGLNCENRCEDKNLLCPKYEWHESACSLQTSAVYSKTTLKCPATCNYCTPPPLRVRVCKTKKCHPYKDFENSGRVDYHKLNRKVVSETNWSSNRHFFWKKGRHDGKMVIKIADGDLYVDGDGQKWKEQNVKKIRFERLFAQHVINGFVDCRLVLYFLNEDE